MITVLNKIDGLTQVSDCHAPCDAEFDADDWWVSPHTTNGRRHDRDTVFRISAKQGIGIDPLVAEIARVCTLDHELIQVELPLDSVDLMSWLRRSGVVIEEAYTETCVQVSTRVSAKVAGQLKKRLAQTGRVVQV